ncbi:MAG: caspase family protein [Bacteroidota bacterium]
MWVFLKQSLFTALLGLTTYVGYTQVNKVPLSASLEPAAAFEGSSRSSKEALYKNLLAGLQRYAVITADHQGAPFYIKPFLTIAFRELTKGTIPPMIFIEAELNLSLVQRATGNILHNYAFTIKGSGDSDNAAYIEAFRNIRYNKADLQSFVKGAEAAISSYFNQNCDKVLAQAENLANTDQYDVAIQTLWAVPIISQECYRQASTRIREYYIRKENLNCKKYINLAETAMAARDYQAAANALVRINPEADCYSQAQSIKEEIQNKTGDTYDKWWEYQFKLLDNSTEIAKAKYDAVGDIGAAAILNSGNLNHGRTDAGNAVIINNNSGAGSLEGAANERLSQRPRKEAIEALFKIISPASRAISGEIVTSDDSVTIYGIIEKPKNARRLTIAGKGTQWDEEGVFSRQVAVPSEKIEIPFVLETNAGKKESRLVTIKKKITSTSSGKNSSTANNNQNLRKVALIIGNNDYKQQAKLRNARNDAIDMTNTLKSIGFSTVRILDASYEQMRSEVIKFSKKLKNADIAFFYYSGHGVEINGENYLIPVDAKISSPDDIKLQSLEVSHVLKSMDILNGSSLNVVILDACRSNPFPKGTRGGDGLARISPPSGMLIAYATEPGSVASDGTEDNGLYTGELIKQIKIPQRIEDVFINTRNEVERKSKKAQRPWEEARLKGVFYLKSEE